MEWSAFSRKPQPVDGEGPVSRFAARAAHVALLFLTLAVPLAGWAVALTAPLQIPSYVFDLVVVPGLPLAISDQAEAFWTEVHATLAYLAVAIVFLHVTAALWHHFIRKDSTSGVCFRLRQPRITGAKLCPTGNRVAAHLVTSF
ncbi:cytochrome b [Agrobacterium radiobacter]|uniref:cytochrome b n=1 Tax=Agrobacterium radiobacter TaxID=362 RepID=UPI0025509D81|nr:cytochrome b/b6 domain-containing protein [Agrobacterium sp. CFBP2214]